MFRHILLATHGTPGAQKAETLALDWARQSGARLTVLSIVNEDWSFMTGDDWLNTSTTRNKFAKYVEDQISGEIGRLWERIRQDFAPLEPEFLRKVGKPETVLAETARELGTDVLVVGANQKKQAPGFKARLKNKELHPLLPCPLVVAP
ncbi:universal stress protein [Pseudodesulfovibrio tunisiensis]|uniref:universal stress protein n=1 Tax=Pseudodesulfovibrio tunisiensis TaxID=463192 RepID=UPI001FB4E8AE|nr:universal stress protein [Pseudodesulfovibrio tunisiensis]